MSKIFTRSVPSVLLEKIEHDLKKKDPANGMTVWENRVVIPVSLEREIEWWYDCHHDEVVRTELVAENHVQKEISEHRFTASWNAVKWWLL